MRAPLERHHYRSPQVTGAHAIGQHSEPDECLIRDRTAAFCYTIGDNESIKPNDMKIRMAAILLLSGTLVGLTFVTVNNNATRTDSDASKLETLKYFQDARLGVAFDYPAQSDNPAVRYYPGDTGEGFDGKVIVPVCTGDSCSNGEIHFGGITDDYKIERGAALAEMGKFTRQGDKYYLQQIGGGIQPIEHPVEEFRASNVIGLLLTGTADSSDLGPTERKAVFNLSKSEFEAISFHWDINSVPDDYAKQILHSVSIQP
jgi:hypothetical protein